MNGQQDLIEAYLGRLAQAGYGLDSAVVHDILADAEDHLRNAMRDGMSAEAAIEAFGKPEDVVRGYVQAEGGRERPAAAAVTPPPNPWAHGGAYVEGAGVVPGMPPRASRNERSNAGPTMRPTVVTPPPVRRSWLACIPVIGIWFDRHAWGSLLFFILGIAPAIVYFTVLVTGISVGVGCVPILVGLPVLVLMLGMARAMALFHGQVIERMTGVRMPRRYAAPPARPENSFWRRIKLWLTDGRSWLSAALLVGNLPVAVVLFGVFVSLVSVSAATLGVPLAHLLGASDCLQFDGADHVQFFGWTMRPDASGHIHLPAEAAVTGLVVGLAVGTLTLYLARAVGWLYAQAAKAIQVTRLTA